MSTSPWGVDLSPTYNPTVDAAAIKAAGASYAVLKVSEGVGWPDATAHPAEFTWLHRVANQVIEARLDLRVYHLGTPSTRADALAEAAWFDRHLALAGTALPKSIGYDLESLPPGLMARECMDIFAAWETAVTGFLPGVPIELYANRSVYDAAEPWLSDPWAQFWIAWPGWTPADALPVATRRVQIGQRTFPGTAGLVDVNVDPAATLADIAEALGVTPVPPPSPVAVPMPKTPTAPNNSDWSLTVHTIDLRNAAATPVRGASIKALQTLLNLSGQHLAVDGIGGAATRGALRSFQAGAHLGVDGVAGPQTWEALCRQ